MFGGDQGRHVEDSADRTSACIRLASSYLLAAIICKWSDSNELGNLTSKDYAALLRWTSVRESLGGHEAVPKHVAAVLSKHGVECSMFKDLVWNWRKYFCRSPCAGKSENMKSHAEQQGRQHHSGQRQAAKVFV